MSFKIIFMGTPEFAVPILKRIFDSKHEILEVYTQPPNKKNRGQKIHKSPIHLLSEKLNIPVRYPISLKEKNELDHLKELKPDIVIVVAYGQIIPTNLLNIENTLFLNIHASLLPRWRGAAPIQRAILNLDQESGVSIMKIVPKLDSGPVLMQSKIKITQETNHEKLSNEMSKIGSNLILEALELIKKNKANFNEQNESEVTYANKIKKIESKIEWTQKKDKIIAKINAFYPNPGSWFKWGIRIKIIKAKKVIYNGKPGTILDDKFTIACLKDAIQILELKKEGKPSMKAEEFLRGNQIEIGQNLN